MVVGGIYLFLINFKYIIFINYITSINSFEKIDNNFLSRVFLFIFFH